MPYERDRTARFESFHERRYRKALTHVANILEEASKHDNPVNLKYIAEEALRRAMEGLGRS